MKFFNWIWRSIEKDLKVIGDGRIALPFSALTLWLADQQKNIRPPDVSDGSMITIFFSVWRGYGITMISIWIMGILIMISLLTKREVFPFERLMLFLSVLLIIASGILTYNWGVEHNQSVFFLD